MSFASGVKEEIAGKTDGARHCRIAFLAAVLHSAGRLTVRMEGGVPVPVVEVQTENESAAQAFASVFEKTFSAKAKVLQGGKGGYRATVSDSGAVREMLEAVRLDKSAEKHISWLLRASKSAHVAEVSAMFQESPVEEVLLKKECCRRAYLRGIFLTSGSVNDPKKSYHFEIQVMTEAEAASLTDMCRSLGLDAKYLVRRRRDSESGYYVVYLKEAEMISDALGMMGASRSMLELENARVVNSVRGTVNRRVNCETANLAKTVATSVRQCEDIEYIRDHYGFENLPELLRQTAQMRLSMPSASLRELAAAMDPPVGRSGVNHRLARLSEIADSLRGKS